MKRQSVKQAAMEANGRSRASKVCSLAFIEGFCKGAEWEKNQLPAIGVVINGKVHRPVPDYRLRKGSNPCDFCSLKVWCATVKDERGDDTMPCDTIVGHEGFHFEKA